jgi:hypothetical protein
LEYYGGFAKKSTVNGWSSCNSLYLVILNLVI